MVSGHHEGLCAVWLQCILARCRTVLTLRALTKCANPPSFLHIRVCFSTPRCARVTLDTKQWTTCRSIADVSARARARAHTHTHTHTHTHARTRTHITPKCAPFLLCVHSREPHLLVICISPPPTSSRPSLTLLPRLSTITHCTGTAVDSHVGYLAGAEEYVNGFNYFGQPGHDCPGVRYCPPPDPVLPLFLPHPTGALGG
jgi:hypothetical protein